MIRKGLSVLLILAAGLLWAAGPDIVKQFGLTVENAKAQTLDSFWGGYVPWELGARIVKAAPPATRAALITGGIGWVKQFTATPEFAKLYQEYRESNRPSPPEGGTPDEEIRKQKAESQKAIEEMRKNLAQLPPETRKEMEKVINDMIAQQKALEKNAEFQAQMQAAMTDEYRRKQEDYQTRLKEYDAKYPADPRPLITRRLREFLDVSANVDFAAKLVPRGSVMIFANPEYEKKPDMWKLCFRAGREAVQAARAAATAWLAELPAK